MFACVVLLILFVAFLGLAGEMAQMILPMIAVCAIFVGSGLLITRGIDLLPEGIADEEQKEKLRRNWPLILAAMIFLLVLIFVGVVFIIVNT